MTMVPTLLRQFRRLLQIKKIITNMLFVCCSSLNSQNTSVNYSEKRLVTYSRVSNRRGGRNKRKGSQISVKIINGEGAINGEVGKNLQS